MQDIEEELRPNDQASANLLREDETINDTPEGKYTNLVKEDEPSNFELVRQHSKIAFPAFISSWSVQVPFLTLIMASFFNDSQKVAGVGLGNTILMICVYLVLFTISMPIEILTGNAHGRKDLKLCGIYLYRTHLVVTVAYIPLVFAVLYAGPVLLYFG